MIEVKWIILRDDDPGWNFRRCLYAYLTPNSREILYVGKAWGATVRARWTRSGKEGFWDDLGKKRKIQSHTPLIGEIILVEGQRLTQELLADIESLLIKKENPWGNIQCQQNRISRPAMLVKCSGKWPGKQKYRDE